MYIYIYILPSLSETCLKEPLALYKFGTLKMAGRISAGCLKSWAAGRRQGMSLAMCRNTLGIGMTWRTLEVK